MRYIALLFMVVIVGCLGEPITTSRSNNSEYMVEELFTHDSITVYRFNDGGTHHYFTKNEAMSTKSCGKNCIYQENIPTQP